MGDPPDDVPDRIVGGRPVARWIKVGYLVLWVAFLAWTVVDRQYTSLVTNSWGLFFAVWLLWRPQTIVDSSGIYLARQLRRAPAIAWDNVDAVVTPTSYATQVGVILKDGTTRDLPLVPAGESAAVAALGGKELRPRPALASSDRPSARPNAREAPELDLIRRIDQLSADRERLLAQLKPSPK